MFNAPTFWGAKFFSITNSTKVGGWKVGEMDTYPKASGLISPFLWLGSFHVPHKGPFYKADFRWKRCIVETVHLCGTITCDLRSFVESISVLGHQILLSSKNKFTPLFGYILQEKLFSLQFLFVGGAMRSAVNKLSFVKRMLRGEKRCLRVKTRIILTPWRDDVQPCDVQGKSLALKKFSLAPALQGRLEIVSSWAHKSQPRIDFQIYLFYFSRKSISGRPRLIVTTKWWQL